MHTYIPHPSETHIQQLWMGVAQQKPTAKVLHHMQSAKETQVCHSAFYSTSFIFHRASASFAYFAIEITDHSIEGFGSFILLFSDVIATLLELLPRLKRPGKL